MADPTTVANTSERDTDAGADPFEQLKAAADVVDEMGFVRAYRTIDWGKESPERHVQALKLALMAGAPGIARALALKGIERYPNYPELHKMAAIFPPSTARIRAGGSNPGIRATRDWLKTHRSEYRGQWVALRNGELLAVADSPDELLQQVGDVRSRDILVMQVF